MSDRIRREAVVIHHLSLDMELDGEPPRTTEKVAESLSGIAWRESVCFLGSDEGSGVEKLRSHDRESFSRRETFPLKALFNLSGDPDEEADVESLAIDADWLWLVTSHARTRSKFQGALKDFAEIRLHPGRYVLGRVPLAADGADLTPVQENGKRKAQCVPLTAKGSALTEELAQDPHLKLSLDLPAKENGLDIEGLAVYGRRIVLGLRGPVLRGLAVLLDLKWRKEVEAGDIPLKRRDGVFHRKIFIDLHGLGVRDLCRRDTDLVILAGPTIPLPAAFRLYVVRGFFEQNDAPDLLEPEYLCDVPSTDGNPEGLCPYGSDSSEFLVVTDGAQADDKVRARALVIGLP